MKQASLRFYAELNDFLPPDERFRGIVREFPDNASVGEMIESRGVPRAAVDLILVSGESVDFEHIPRGGDRVSVYPVFEALDIRPVLRVRSEPLRRPRFAVDARLAPLAERLAALGFDTIQCADTAEHRILLTPDPAMLEREDVTHAYCVRETDAAAQLREVLARLDLERISAMMNPMIDRERAWQILCEFTKSENLRKHALAVEACVVAYARQYAEDEAKWSVTALLHDFDWEIHPEAPDHPMKGEPLLAERGVPEDIRRAILSHAGYSGVPRESRLEKTLFACDELAGFITAISYVKPKRSVHEVDAPSVRKKMKDKAFARSVNRQDIIDGAQLLGVDLDQHIAFCVKAMQERAEQLGLQGLSAPAAPAASSEPPAR